VTVTAFRKTDPTAAARSRRYRRRRKQGAATRLAVTPHRDGNVVQIVTLLAALAVAGVSAGFSIIGLTSIFAGAFWPIIGMGVAFEFGKLAAVTWLGRRSAAPRPVKAALAALVVTLMVLNALGAYGFLAHAHLAHAVTVEQAVYARAADVTARTEVQRAALVDVDKRIAQIDSAVDEATRRGRTAGAMILVAQETARRKDLVAERISAANTLAALQVEAAQVDGDRAAIKADSGPIRYLSALIGADDESVMRWFILLVAVLLDPLAVALLLAATVARPGRSLAKALVPAEIVA
jgi:hypothetical protein